MLYFINPNSPMAPLARKAKERNMARRQTPAQRRASLKNLAKARRARGHGGRKRRRNPPPRGVRTAVWRKRSPAKRKYSYSKKHSRRVIRTNPPRRHRRRYRRNPGLGSFFNLSRIKEGAVMLGGFYVGRGLTNTAVKYIPFPTTGIMAVAVRVGVAIAQSMVVGKFLGPKWGQMAFVGGISTAIDPYVKALPVVGAAIGEDMGSYMMGEYYGMGDLPVGEVPLPLGEDDIAVGEYRYS